MINHRGHSQFKAGARWRERDRSRSGIQPHADGLHKWIVIRGVVYIGVSSSQETLALNPDYPYCSFRGSIVALDEKTGQMLWKTFDMPETARQKRTELTHLKKRYSLLTPREQEVLPFVVGGLLNKETAAELGTSEITIRVHRGQIMRKMGARARWLSSS